MKIGLLGCAHAHVNIYCTQWNRDASLDIQPMAVWDRDGARGARMAEQFGLQICDSPAALLERTDLAAVVIASETSLHAELVEVAAAAGKAIVLQKPMALTLAEGQRIAAAVGEERVPFTMAWQMRVDPENMKMRELINDDVLGRIYQIRRRHCLSMLLNPAFESSWHVDPRYNRDIFADDAAHAIDFVYWLFGVPQAITARMTTAHKATMPNDQGVALFEYAHGLLAEVSSSFTSIAGENTTEIVGEKGVLVQNYGDAPSADKRFDADAPSMKWYLRAEDQWVISDVEAPKAQGERIAGLAGPLADFLHGRCPPLATFEDGLNALRMVLGCYEASETGRRVQWT